MVTPGPLLSFVVLIAAYLGACSLFASIRHVPLWNFWGGILGAVGPWVVATLVVLVASTFVPKALQQAAGMAVLFPMIATVGVALISPLVSAFLRKDAVWTWKLKWFAVVSAVPAILMTAALLYTFIRDSRKG
jgi:MFS family permease